MNVNVTVKAANIAHGQRNEKFIDSKGFQNSYSLRQA